MFECMFTRATTIERYRAAPHADERLRYLLDCLERGFARQSLRKIAVHQLDLIRLLKLEVGGTVSLSRIEAAAREWSRPGVHRYGRPASPKAHKAFVGHAVGWLRFVGWLEEPQRVCHPHTAQVAAFVAWMRGDRGLSETTIRGCRIAVDEFFDWLAPSGIPLSSIKVTDVDRAIAAKSVRRDYSRVTLRTYAQRLRTFFRFAEEQGWCASGLAAAIIPPRVYPDQTLPAGLQREDVQRLLATTEGNRPVDKRDRAILMLLIAYGLRAGEVCGLQLDDLNWEEETLHVRCPKLGRRHLYPLSRGVGQAILRYIREDRPARTERTLFFTLRAPIRPLGSCALRQIVSKRLDRLGIVVKHRGPHALRHSCAQHLLDQGLSMKVIGDYLGHRSISATAVYARVDLNALREVADFDLEGLA